MNCRLRIGYYPGTSISEARKQARVYSGQRAKGIDPKQAIEDQKTAKLAAMAKAAAMPTVAAIAEDFLIAKRSNKSIKTYRKMLKKDVLEVIGSKPAAEVTWAQINGIINTVRARGNRTQHVRLFELVRAMFRWAAQNELIETNPASGKSVQGEEQARKRVLNEDEIRTFRHRLSDCEMPLRGQRILKLQLLLGQRSGEIAGMRIGELSSDRLMWTIPAGRAKNAREQVVPLSPAARDILRDVIAEVQPNRKQPYLFPNDVGGPTSSDVVSGWMEDARDVFGFTDPVSGDPNPITAHDLRRTCATALQQIGTPNDVIAVILNHISAKNTKVTGRHYTHADLSKEARWALVKWQATLEDILEGGNPLAPQLDRIEEMEAELLNRHRTKRADNVVPMARRVS